MSPLGTGRAGLLWGCAALAAAMTWSALALRAAASAVEMQIDDENSYHVFAPQQGFEIVVTPRLMSGMPPPDLAYQWVDFLGNPLTSPVALTLGEPEVIRSPSSALDIGYFGLRFLPDDGSVTFNPVSGSRREIGFGVLPEDDERQIRSDSRFGIVHYRYRDPYLNPGWMKTATETQIISGPEDTGAAWHDRLQRNRRAGQLELPLVYGETWQNGSLDELRRMMRGIFRADPRPEGTAWLPAYELGLEENLTSGRFRETLAQAAAKFRVAREERDRIDPSVKLGYQIAGTRLEPYRQLLESPLATEIDFLSAHPYPWDDWPSPDSWHDDFVDSIRDLMQRNGLDLPIWYTEVGAFQNDAGAVLMYSGRRPVGSQTRAEYAAYLVKLHAHAFDKGIDKVFWYNYMDRSASATNAEAHFGLRDHWGFPKPGYLAYAATTRCMKGRSASRLTAADSRIKAYLFSGVYRDCLVAWLSPEGSETLELTALDASLSAARVVEAFDTVGAPVSLADRRITLSTYPLFLILSRPSAADGAHPRTTDGPLPPAQAADDTASTRPAGRGAGSAKIAVPPAPASTTDVLVQIIE